MFATDSVDVGAVLQEFLNHVQIPRSDSGLKRAAIGAPAKIDVCTLF